VFLSDTALIERNVYFEKAARAGRIDGVDDTLDMRSKQRPLLPTELRVPLHQANHRFKLIPALLKPGANRVPLRYGRIGTGVA